MPRQPSMHMLLLPSQTLALVGPPQSASLMHGTHMPMVASAEVQGSPTWQPLPFIPRQPGTQVWVDVSQTVALVGPPQLASVMQAKHIPMVASAEVQASPG